MKSEKYLSRAVLLVLAAVTGGLILAAPTAAADGAARGLLICGDVIIPSLFPFTVCVLMLTGFTPGSGKISKTAKVRRMTPQRFLIFLLSLTGGYPTGAKMISSLRAKGGISAKNAGYMVCFCVGAGPAFITVAVGRVMIGSANIGYILLCAHIAAAAVTAFLISRFIKPDDVNIAKSVSLTGAELFTDSVGQASSAVLTVCACVIFFSSVNSATGALSVYFPPATVLQYLLEVTTAVAATKNIYLISFLLGFGGISIWCQVLSLSSGCDVPLPLFIGGRLTHGILSVAFTRLLMLIIKPSADVFSSAGKPDFSLSYTTLSLSMSLVIMAVLLLITLKTKKYSGNLLQDLI